MVLILTILYTAPRSGAHGQDFSNFQFGGDFRLRIRYDDFNNDPNRTRTSLRLRLNSTLLFSDSLLLHFGLAGGNGEPRNRNLTFTDYFAAKPVWIDHAYIDWRPVNQLTFFGGKMKNPLWLPTQYLWDGDITQEGVAVQVDTFTDPLSGFLNTGVFVLDEISTLNNPMYIPMQLGLNYAFEKGQSIRFSATYNFFTNLDNLVPADPEDPYFDYSAGTNTLEGGSLKYDYDSIGANVEVYFPNVLPPALPSITLLAEYLYNFDPPSDNQAYLAGVKFGHLDVFSAGEWRVFYGYGRIERDAWLDIFPESTYLSGATNIQGHALRGDIGIGNRIWLRVLLGYATEIVGDTTQVLVQSDLNFRF
jgi:hypothetical protein